MKCLFLRTFSKEYSQGFILFVRSKSLLSNRFVQLSHTNGDSNILIILRCSYKIKALRKAKYCVKSVRIRSFSGAYFPAFGPNTERFTIYSVSLRFQCECGKIRTRKTSNTDSFYTVQILSMPGCSVN